MIGAGNLIYFPLLVSEHGAVSILVIYSLVLTFLGYPLLLVQMGLAQFTSKGPAGCWEFAILFKGVGYAIMFFIIVFGGEVMRTLMDATFINYKYLIDDYNISEAYQLLVKPDGGNATDRRNTTISNAGHGIIPNTDAKHDVCSYMFLINWALIILHLLPETRKRGKISSFIFVANITTVVVLTIRSITLPGALKGIKFAFRDTSLDILNLNIWHACLVQCFYSLNLNPCYHMTTASFNDFHNLIPFDTLVCLLLDTCMSVVGVFLTFSLLGHLSVTTNFNLEDLSEMSGMFRLNIV